RETRRAAPPNPPRSPPARASTCPSSSTRGSGSRSTPAPAPTSSASTGAEHRPEDEPRTDDPDGPESGPQVRDAREVDGKIREARPKEELGSELEAGRRDVRRVRA